jgi:hypothetical protein
LTPATYTVTASIGSCYATATVQIRLFPDIPVPDITQSQDTLFASIELVYKSYQWYYNDTIIPNATNPFYKAPASGNYNVAVTDTNGCNTSVGINIVLNVGLKSFTGSDDFLLYPNPVTDQLFISGSRLHENDRVIIFNAVGEKVREQKIKEAHHAMINIADLSAGVYFIRIENSDRSWLSRFMKE